MMDDYEDIIDYPYPPPGRLLFGHPRMAVGDRAKIFSAFAALKGHEEAIEERVKEKYQEGYEH